MEKTIITILVTAIFTTALTTSIISIMYPNYLNMATVTDYETTDTGLMLYTSNGSGWYVEK